MKCTYPPLYYKVTTLDAFTLHPGHIMYIHIPAIRTHRMSLFKIAISPSSPLLVYILSSNSHWVAFRNYSPIWSLIVSQRMALSCATKTPTAEISWHIVLRDYTRWWDEKQDMGIGNREHKWLWPCLANRISLIMRRWPRRRENDWKESHNDEWWQHKDTGQTSEIAKVCNTDLLASTAEEKFRTKRICSTVIVCRG